MTSLSLHKFCFSLIISCLALVIQAQDINWIMQPNVKNVDQLTIPSSPEQNPLKLLMVKKDGKYGLVDVNGDIIIPVDNDRVQVWNGGKHCSRYKNKVQKFYDNEGYELEEAEVVEISDNRQRSDQAVRMNEKIDVFKSKNSKIDVIKEGNRFVVINSETRDTLVSRWNKKTKITENGIVLYQGSAPDYNLIAVDVDGNELQRFGNNANIEYQDESNFIIKDLRKYGLYDSRFKQLLPNEYDRMSKIGDNRFIIEKDDKCFIADSNGKPLYSMTANYIYQSDDKKILIGQDKRATYLFDSTSNSFKTYDFGLASIYKNKTKYLVTNTDTLKGYFDLISGELIVPLKYRYASIENGLFIGTNDKFVKTKRMKRFYVNGHMSFKDVYNSSGDLILSDTIKSVERVAAGYFSCTMKDKKIKIIDENGKVLKELEEGTRLNPKHGRFVGVQNSGQRGFRYYTKADFLAGKMDKSYSSLGDILTYKDSETKYIIAGNDGKYGIIDLEGNTLIPFVFEKIEENRKSSELMIVKKDGAFGIIKAPVSI